jgi:hypothetical protein
MMEKYDIDELERLEKAATKDWSKSREDMDSYCYNPDSGSQECEHVAYLYRKPDDRAAFYGEHNRDDLRLIVAARNALPAMIADLRKLRAENERLKGIVAKLSPHADAADRYMIASFKHGYVGNDVQFWGPESRGYTCMLDEAGTYSRKEALQIHRDDGYSQTYMLPVAWVHEHLHGVVEIQRAGGKEAMVAASRKAYAACLNEYYDASTGEHVLKCDFCPAVDRYKAPENVSIDFGDWRKRDLP